MNRRINSKILWGSGMALAAFTVMGVAGATFAHPATTASTSTTPATTAPGQSITVLGVAGQSDANGTSSPIMANVNLSGQGSSASDALDQVQSQQKLLTAALKSVGISANDINVTNQNISANGGTSIKNMPESPSSASPSGQSVQFNANENLQISLTSSNETAVLNAVAQSISSSNSGSFNVYINNGGPPSGVPAASSSTLNQAMDVAHSEAQAIATKMGATLGTVQNVKQLSYQGPFTKANQTMIELQVTYSVQ